MKLKFSFLPQCKHFFEYLECKDGDDESIQPIQPSSRLSLVSKTVWIAVRWGKRIKFKNNFVRSGWQIWRWW